MKRKKTLRNLLLLTVLLVLALAPMNAQAASQKTKALKAYQTFLKKSTVKLSGRTCKLASAKFAIVYIDNDSVPELLVQPYYKMGNNKLSITALYTYKNNKMVRLFVSNNGLTYSKCSYYKKTGTFLRYISHGDYQSYYYYKLSGKKLTKKLAKEWEAGKTTYHKASGAKITKSQFNKQLKSLTRSKKATTIPLRKNTASNRSRYLK